MTEAKKQQLFTVLNTALQNMYSDDAILFRKQRKIFEDTIRKYHNGTEKYKMAMAV